jgi:hypothetical protein
MSTAHRDEIVAIFERHRQTPGADFAESHFIDYLLAHPKGNRSVHNSFLGLRRYNRFIEEVQMHFGVYFSIKDWEANYPLTKFVQRVSELQSSRRSSLASFRSHVRRGFGWNTVLVLSFFGIASIYALWQYSPVASMLILACLLVGHAWAVKAYLHWRSYHHALEARLTAQTR